MMTRYTTRYVCLRRNGSAIDRIPHRRSIDLPVRNIAGTGAFDGRNPLNGKRNICILCHKAHLVRLIHHNTDEGARYVGEFAIGVNPYITKPMNNILFDEKKNIHFEAENSED